MNKRKEKRRSRSSGPVAVVASACRRPLLSLEAFPVALHRRAASSWLLHLPLARTDPGRPDRPTGQDQAISGLNFSALRPAEVSGIVSLSLSFAFSHSLHALVFVVFLPFSANTHRGQSSCQAVMPLPPHRGLGLDFCALCLLTAIGGTTPRWPW